MKTKNAGDGDDSSISPLGEAAISLNVMYQELRRAGFSRRDALELISKMMIGSMSEEVENQRGLDDL